MAQSAIQKIITNYEGFWGRLTNNSDSRLKKAWQDILSLSAEDIKNASKENLEKLNRIIDAAKLKNQRPFLKELLDYAKNIYREHHNAKIFSQLHIDPEFLFSHLIFLEETENNISFLFDFFRYFSKNISASSRFKLVQILSKHDKISELEALFAHYHANDLHVWDIEQFLCHPKLSLGKNYSLDTRLYPIIMNCVKKDKELHDNIYNGNQPWSDEVQNELLYGLNSLAFLKTLPYQDNDIRSHVVSLVENEIFRILSYYPQDKWILEGMNSFGFGDHTLSSNELITDYKKWIRARLFSGYFTRLETNYTHHVDINFHNVYMYIGYPALSYLFKFNTDLLKNPPNSTGYTLLKEQPDLWPQYTSMYYILAAGGPSLVPDAVENALAFFDPVLTQRTKEKPSPNAIGLAKDLLSKFNKISTMNDALKKIKNYYEKNQKKQAAILPFIHVIAENPYDYFPRVLNFISFMTLCIKEYPEYTDEILSAFNKLQQTQADLCKNKNILKQDLLEQKLAFYPSLLLSLPDKHPKREEIIKNLCVITGREYPPQEKLVFQDMNSSVINMWDVYDLAGINPKQWDWLVQHGFVQIEDAFSRYTNYYHGDIDLPSKYAAILLQHYKSQEYQANEKIRYDKTFAMYIFDRLTSYLKSYDKISENPKDPLSIQSLLSNLSIINSPNLYLHFTEGDIISQTTSFVEQVLLKAFKMKEKNPSLAPLVHAAVMNLEKSVLLDYKILWPLLKQEIKPQERYQYILSILSLDVQTLATVLPEVLELKSDKAGLQSHDPRDIFSHVWSRLSGRDPSVQKEIISTIPWKDYYTIDEILKPEKFPRFSRGSLERNNSDIFLSGAILSNFPESEDVKKKVLTYLNASLNKKTGEKPGDLISHLVPVVKTLTLGKICSKEELEKLSPFIQAAYKIMRHDPEAISYLSTHYTPQQILDDELYYKVFSTMLRYQRFFQNNQPPSSPQGINKHHLSELADRVTHFMDEDYRLFCEIISRFSSLEEYADILPYDWKNWSEKDRTSLKNFLLNNLVYAPKKKKFLRDSTELRQICASWQKLDDDERSGHYKEVFVASQIKIYEKVRSIDFALEAKRCGVPPKGYKKAEDLFLAAQSIPEPFSVHEQFTVEDPVFGKLTGRFLPRSDPRVFSFGTHTDCCQRWGGLGEACALSSMLDPFSQVFVIENEEGKLIAGSWVWRTEESQNYGVCFDNVETKGGYHRIPFLNRIYEQAAEHLCKNGARIVTVGSPRPKEDDMMVETFYKQAEKCLTLNNYKGYSDARTTQFIIAERKEPSAIPDTRDPFFIRPEVIDSAHSYSLIPEEIIDEHMQKASLDQLRVLVDKNGGFQGVSFVHPEREKAFFFINPFFAQENPKALDDLWNVFQHQTAMNPDIKNWEIHIPEKMKPIFEALKDKGKISFAEGLNSENSTTSVSITPPTNIDHRLLVLDKIPFVAPKLQRKQPPRVIKEPPRN